MQNGGTNATIQIPWKELGKISLTDVKMINDNVTLTLRSKLVCEMNVFLGPEKHRDSGITFIVSKHVLITRVFKAAIANYDSQLT